MSSSRMGRASRFSGSSPPTATRGRTVRSPITSRPPATTSARSASRSTAPTSSPPATRQSTTTTRRSWSRRSRTGFAEAFAEFLHRQARREWYEPDEQLSSEDLAAEKFPRHPAGVRVPGMSRPHREAKAVRPPRGGPGGARPDGVVRDDAGIGGERDLPREPECPLLLGRPGRPRPGRGLRRSEGHEHRGSRTLARAQPWVREPHPRSSSALAPGRRRRSVAPGSPRRRFETWASRDLGYPRERLAPSETGAVLL